MGWRGLVACVTLLAAGIVGGFAAAAYRPNSSISDKPPTPVAATDPSFPINPPTEVLEDPPEPALQTDLAMNEVSVGAGRYMIVFPAPEGWSRNETSSNEVKYKLAGNPDNTFILRVEQVISQHEQIPDMVLGQIQKLNADVGVEQLKVRYRTHDSLEVSFVNDGYRRFALYTWLDLTHSGEAEVEIALTGRRKDLPGMLELMAQVIRGIDAA